MISLGKKLKHSNFSTWGIFVFEILKFDSSGPQIFEILFHNQVEKQITKLIYNNMFWGVW